MNGIREKVKNNLNREIFKFYSKYYNDIDLGIFYLDGENKFHSREYYCHFLGKYFEKLIDDLLDLSILKVFGLDEDYTFIIRKKLGIIDNTYQIIENKEIAMKFGLKREKILSLYTNARIELRIKFLDYAYEHFIEDVKENNISLSEISFFELYPYDIHLVEKLRNFFNTETLTQLCSFEDVRLIISTCYSDINGKDFVNARINAVMYRILRLLNNQDNDLQLDNIEMLDKSIRSIGFSAKINGILFRYGIYTIYGLCSLNKNSLLKMEGIGTSILSEIVSKMDSLDLHFNDERNNIEIKNKSINKKRIKDIV